MKDVDQAATKGARHKNTDRTFDLMCEKVAGHGLRKKTSTRSYFLRVNISSRNHKLKPTARRGLGPQKWVPMLTKAPDLVGNKNIAVEGRPERVRRGRRATYVFAVEAPRPRVLEIDHGAFSYRRE